MEDKTIQNSQGNGVQPTKQDNTNTSTTNSSTTNSTTNSESKQGVITVIIKDPQGNEVGQFIAEDGKNIIELAAMHGIDIPISCGAGVCGVCLCKVESGNDVVKGDAFNSPLMPLQNDENGNPQEILACISGFNPEKFNDGQNHTVILQRTY